MKKYILYSTLMCVFLSGCKFNQNHGPVPEDWFVLPENGSSQNQGSADEFGQVVEHIFSAQAKNLDQFSNLNANVAAPTNNPPADWVPWYLAIVSTDFAVTTSGVFGALLGGQGSASVQANWLNTTLGQTNIAGGDFKIKKSNLPRVSTQSQANQMQLSGTPTHADVVNQLEPAIQAAIASGKVSNAGSFRQTVLTAGENFRQMASALSQLHLQSNSATGFQFIPTAYRLEISVNGQGQVTPMFAIGGAVNFRFDWVINSAGGAPVRLMSDSQAISSPAGSKLLQFVQSVTPDIQAAVQSSSANQIQKSGYALSSVRLGLTLNADFQVGVASFGGEAIASIVFGDNEEEGGCFDPDGDGDCHNHRIMNAATSAQMPVATDEGVLFIKNSSTQHLAYAAQNGIKTVHNTSLMSMNKSTDGQEKTAYLIPHQRFQNGLVKALRMAQFFTEHAAKSNNSNWKIKELSAEFNLSISGTFGLSTVGVGGELELEFENKGLTL